MHGEWIDWPHAAIDSNLPRRDLHMDMRANLPVPEILAIGIGLLAQAGLATDRWPSDPLPHLNAQQALGVAQARFDRGAAIASWYTFLWACPQHIGDLAIVGIDPQEPALSLVCFVARPGDALAAQLVALCSTCDDLRLHRQDALPEFA